MLMLSGRLRVVKELNGEVKEFRLNIGCKETRFGNINIDINPLVKPNVIADALHLPFKEEVFNLVYFTEVIEHLPKNTESLALSEIYRVLKKGGILILTTPNDRMIYTWLDPARYVMDHRHYRLECVQKMIEALDFKIEKIFTAGGFWETISTLWYCLITYPLKKTGVNVPYCPKFLKVKVDEEYNRRIKRGYTIFIKAKK